MSNLGPIEVRRRTGDEAFHEHGRPRGFTLLQFWQWSASDIVSNATRGIVAEYLVAMALGLAEHGVRDEWAAYDLQAQDGVKIEVKSAAYVQSWNQDRLSTISFSVSKTRAWDRQSNRQSAETRRQADVYVFALLAHKDKATIDPLDVAQWEFYVAPTRLLDERSRSQHSITLPSLRKLVGKPVGYAGLKAAIEKVAGPSRGPGEARAM